MLQKRHAVNIKFSLPVSFLREGRYFIAYTPALDLSTYGKSYEEARVRFGEVLQIFFEEILEKHTVDKVLSDLGWQKVRKQWVPPTLIAQETETITVPLVN